ncbi:hypothetical protein [Thalassobacillus sp. CUG 92003]|nr:hypothetical protein [Thalassobacillus sp. CUG 92003]
MVRVKFYWSNGEKNGHFLVESPSLKECMEIGEQEVTESGATLDDWQFA